MKSHKVEIPLAKFKMKLCLYYILFRLAPFLADITAPKSWIKMAENGGNITDMTRSDQNADTANTISDIECLTDAAEVFNNNDDEFLRASKGK